MARYRSNSKSSRRGEVLWIGLWLLGLGVIITYAVLRVIPGLERNTLAEVQKAIGGIVTSPVMISVRGHRATITGDAASEAERSELLAAIENTRGVGEVVDRLSVKNTAASADADNDTLPDSGIPTSVLSAANTATISDPLPAPEELPPEPLASTDAASAPATQDEPATDPVPAAVADNAGSDPSAPQPALSIRMADKALTLEGRLDPSVDMTSLVQPAVEAFDPSYLTNRIQASEPTATAQWLTPLTGLLPALGALSDPGIDITGRQITLSGTAASREQHDRIIENALDALADFALVERIDVVAPEVAAGIEATGEPASAPADTVSAAVSLQLAMKNLDDQRIQFKPASAEFVDGSEPRLNAIASLFGEFRDTRIEIEGHTDTSGEADANMLLSQQRAITVREALVDRGIERSRLVAYGYGEGIPLVDNATPEGRARNRRIEFRIKPLEGQP